MQLFALNRDNQIVSAENAERKVDYFCRECKGALRLRGGIQIKKHFFHLSLTTSCRQSKKSMIHLQAQYYIKRNFPCEEAVLERQFPEIGRIADVVWEPGKLVFEVQCSPISKEEVAARNFDYGSIGYTVVWILHDLRYNRWKMSPAEFYLRHLPHYFTNIDSLGKGYIYDQIDCFKGRNRHTLKRLADVKLHEPCKIEDFKSQNTCGAPSLIECRSSHWPLYFSGDLMDLWSRDGSSLSEYLEKAQLFENSLYRLRGNPLFFRFSAVFQNLIVRPYKTLFQWLLERSCR